MKALIAERFRKIKNDRGGTALFLRRLRFRLCPVSLWKAIVQKEEVMRKRIFVSGIAVLFLVMGGLGVASMSTEGDEKKSEEKALAQTVDALVTAFNKGDTKALAALWSETGILVGRETGEPLKGRQDIAREYASRLARFKGTQMAIALDSTRLITPDVASLHGTAKISRTGELPAENAFAMILVKKGGKWLIDSLKEEAETVIPVAHSEQLKDLEWMIGEWAQNDKDVEVRIVCSWKANKNFMSRFFTVKTKGEITHQGSQIVGWDPIQKRIRSWVFESDGTFGEAVWKHDGDRWTIKSHGILPDGKRTTATQVITKIDADKYNWQSLARAVDGRPLANTAETILTRSSNKGKE
jgi:uncharacterized protein (TIGR02246 family)